jgi:antitoxin (DNA-binding transcriptional repressor) of toxin-antitoxin stability system
MKLEVGARELRNNTAELLRRVEAGSEVVITSRGKPVATLNRLRPEQRRWLGRDELVRRLGVAQADPELRSDLKKIAGDTTDDLGPIG